MKEDRRVEEKMYVRLFNVVRHQLITRALLADGVFLFPSCVELNYSAHLITKTSKPRRREKSEKKKNGREWFGRRTR